MNDDFRTLTHELFHFIKTKNIELLTKEEESLIKDFDIESLNSDEYDKFEKIFLRQNIEIVYLQLKAPGLKLRSLSCKTFSWNELSITNFAVMCADSLRKEVKFAISELWDKITYFLKYASLEKNSKLVKSSCLLLIILLFFLKSSTLMLFSKGGQHIVYLLNKQATKQKKWMDLKHYDLKMRYKTLLLKTRRLLSPFFMFSNYHIILSSKKINLHPWNTSNENDFVPISLKQSKYSSSNECEFELIRLHNYFTQNRLKKRVEIYQKILVAFLKWKIEIWKKSFNNNKKKAQNFALPRFEICRICEKKIIRIQLPKHFDYCNSSLKISLELNDLNNLLTTTLFNIFKFNRGLLLKIMTLKKYLTKRQFFQKNQINIEKNLGVEEKTVVDDENLSQISNISSNFSEKGFEHNPVKPRWHRARTTIDDNKLKIRQQNCKLQKNHSADNRCYCKNKKLHRNLHKMHSNTNRFQSIQTLQGGSDSQIYTDLGFDVMTPQSHSSSLNKNAETFTTCVENLENDNNLRVSRKSIFSNANKLSNKIKTSTCLEQPSTQKNYNKLTRKRFNRLKQSASIELSDNLDENLLKVIHKLKEIQLIVDHYNQILQHKNVLLDTSTNQIHFLKIHGFLTKFDDFLHQIKKSTSLYSITAFKTVEIILNRLREKQKLLREKRKLDRNLIAMELPKDVLNLNQSLLAKNRKIIKNTSSRSPHHLDANNYIPSKSLFNNLSPRLKSMEYAHDNKVDEIEDLNAIDDPNKEKLHFSFDDLGLLSNPPNQPSLPNELSIDSFKFIKFIGKGAYGRVWLVEKISTHELYAMKIINAAEKPWKKNFDDIKFEGNLMNHLATDFVVKGYFSFVHETYICFVMDYLSGGDLASLISREIWLPEYYAKFYCADILLCLEFLHSLNIIHRDLKPDNILFNKYGHVCLTDFGLSEDGIKTMKKIDKDKEIKELLKDINKLSKEIEKKSNIRTERDIENTSVELNELDEECKNNRRHHFEKNRIIGSVYYLAPEMIDGTGAHSTSVDYWALGVLTFEMLTGTMPFMGDTEEDIMRSILKDEINWDDFNIGDEDGYLSPIAVDFISKMLKKDPAQRLGANDPNERKQHPFLKDFDFTKFRTQKAPYIPTAQSIHQANQEKIYIQEELKNPFFSPHEAQQKSPELKKTKTHLNTLFKPTINLNALCEQNFNVLSKQEGKKSQPIGSSSPENRSTQSWNYIKNYPLISEDLYEADNNQCSQEA